MFRLERNARYFKERSIFWLVWTVFQKSNVSSCAQYLERKLNVTFRNERYISKMSVPFFTAFLQVKRFIRKSVQTYVESHATKSYSLSNFEKALNFDVKTSLVLISAFAISCLEIILRYLRGPSSSFCYRSYSFLNLNWPLSMINPLQGLN